MPFPNYCKRLRMEIDLRWVDAPPVLPPRLVWVPWHETVLRDHAEITHRSFRGELDALVFPNLATPVGCVQLMGSIRDKPGFSPDATWLIASSEGCCGTVQGIRDGNNAGAIQNLGVIPLFRGIGLGRALLLKALDGFRRNGLKQANLEVSAVNRAAGRLYHEVGFIIRKTLYREFAVQPEVEYSI